MAPSSLVLGQDKPEACLTLQNTLWGQTEATHCRTWLQTTPFLASSLASPAYHSLTAVPQSAVLFNHLYTNPCLKDSFCVPRT